MKKALPLLLLIFLLLSCARNADEGALPLRIALAQEPPSLDVMLTSSISARMIAQGNVYEKLVRLEEGKAVPELAESWELSPDGRRLTFRLRPGVTFHDGAPMASSDVSSSLNRWLESYSPAQELCGDARFTAGEGTVSIESSRSLALLPLMLASSPQAAVIMPERLLGPLVSEYVGTGPYRFISWKSGEGAELERYEGYWGDAPAIDRLSYLFVPDSVTRRLGLETGLYDAIDTVSNDDIPQLSEIEGIRLLQGEESGEIALVLNRTRGPMRSPELRRVLSVMLDRENLMRSCYGSSGYSLHSDYMEKSAWSVPDSLDPYGEGSSEPVPELLAEAGETKVKILTSNLSGLDRIALALSSELGRLGIDSEITLLDWVSFLEKRKDLDAWDIYISAYTRTALPSQKAYLKGYEELLRPVSEAETEEEALEAWREVQQLLWEDVPVIIPGHYSTTYAVKQQIKGVEVRDGFYFMKAWAE